MKKFTISKAKPKDFPEIFGLLKQLWPKKEHSKEALKKIFLEGLKRPQEEYLVGKLNNEIIGFASFKYEWSFYYKGKTVCLSELIVDNKFQNKGYGSKMLAEVINIAKKNSCKCIELSSASYRVKAHKFYKSKGFKKDHSFFKEL